MIRILVLLASSNVLYFLWRCLCCFASHEDLALYVKSTFTIKNAAKFLILNESPFGGHLWYLGAILYVLLIMSFIFKNGWVRLLYVLIPFLLTGDLLLGKYSLLLFGREFPYVIVRNWLFVGLPYFSLGILIVEHADRLRGMMTKIRLCAAIILFSCTTLLERYFLVSNALNSARDHYLSTTLLAVSMFLLVLFYTNWNESVVSKIGRRDSTWVYIIHPINISVLGRIAVSCGIEQAYNLIRPVVVFAVTVLIVDTVMKLINDQTGSAYKPLHER